MSINVLSPDTPLLSPRYRRHKRLSLTPLIDVIFLLLVFFMLSSHFYSYAIFNVAVTPNTETSSNIDNTEHLLIEVPSEDTISIQKRHFTLDEIITALPETLLSQPMTIQLHIAEEVPVQTTLIIMQHLQAYEQTDIHMTTTYFDE